MGMIDDLLGTLEGLNFDESAFDGQEPAVPTMPVDTGNDDIDITVPSPTDETVDTDFSDLDKDDGGSGDDDGGGGGDDDGDDD